MATIITELKDKFTRGNIVLQFVSVNAGVFVSVLLLSVVMQLFRHSQSDLLLWLQLPADLSRLLLQPWSVFTYMFLHTSLLHILFNMLWLYWFGALFLQFFSARHFRALYLLGGIAGGLFYITAYNVFPLFSDTVHHATLLGASASVLAIVVATAFRQPDYPIRLLLLGTFKLKYVALVVVGLDLLSITSSNAGGHMAHLGGALAGLIFAAALQRGTDVTRWINHCLDLPNRLHAPRKHKPKMKVTHGGAAYSRTADYDYNQRRKEQNDEIDRILDKLKQSGYESLTTCEKKTLFEASRR